MKTKKSTKPIKYICRNCGDTYLLARILEKETRRLICVNPQCLGKSIEMIKVEVMEK